MCEDLRGFIARVFCLSIYLYVQEYRKRGGRLKAYIFFAPTITVRSLDLRIFK